MLIAPSFFCCSIVFLISCRMSFAFLVNESNIWTLSTQNPFVFAISYHFPRKYSRTFINYFHLLCLILPGLGVFPFKHYLLKLLKNPLRITHLSYFIPFSLLSIILWKILTEKPTLSSYFYSKCIQCKWMQRLV